MLKAFERWGAKASQTAILLSVLGVPALAQAQAKDVRAPEGNGDGLDTHLFRPAVDSKGFFSVNGSDILGTALISDVRSQFSVAQVEPDSLHGILHKGDLAILTP